MTEQKLTATGKKRTYTQVSLEVVFNGTSGSLARDLEIFLQSRMDIRPCRGGFVVPNGTHSYFMGEYTPEGANAIVSWLEERGVGFSTPDFEQ